MPLFPPSRYSDHELPGVVADVCCEVSPTDPTSVSQPKFDKARAAVGHPDAPTAKRICVRLRLGWEALKALALDPTRNVERTVGIRTGEKDADWLTDAACIAALRLVAKRLADGIIVTIAAYEAEAASMVAASARRHVHGCRLVFRARRRAHTRPRHNEGTYAYRVAARFIEQGGVLETTRARNCENRVFQEHFRQACERVAKMEFRVVEIEDDRLAAVFEVYAATILQTKNSWATS